MSFAPEKTAILFSFFEKGMTTKRSKLCCDAAVASGLPVEAVKNWVGNKLRNRRKRRAQTGCDLNGYNLFCRDHMKKEDIKHAGAAWSALPAEEKAKYLERARVESIVEGSEEGKLLRRKRLMKQLKDQVKLLEDEGMHVGVMVSDPFTNNSAVITTESVSSFMDKTMPGFMKHLGEGEHHKPSAAAVKSDLVKKVQDLFNQKYVEAGGKGPFPYKAVSKGTKNITVSGLPHPFKRPYSLGAKQLRDILNKSDDITVHIDEATVEDAPEEPGQNVESDQESEQEGEQESDLDSEGVLDLSPQKRVQDSSPTPNTSRTTSSSVGLQRTAATVPLQTAQEPLSCSTIDMEMWQEVSSVHFPSLR